MKTAKKAALVLAFGALVPAGWTQQADPKEINRKVTERNDAYAVELEQHFREFLVRQYPERAARAWNRSYANEKAFLKSVEPNRERYRRVFSPPDLKPSGPVQRTPHPALAEIQAEWVSVPLGGIKAEGILAVPRNVSGRVPLIIAQHGIGSSPERVFGLGDQGNLYKSYGKVLVDAGFAVLAPANLMSIDRRNRIERLAQLAGTTLPGLEFARMRVLLDTALEDKRIDPGRIGMWGISLGGMATMFWMPLEPRIQCGVVTAWFNHRRNKMVVPDERYSCFLETREEHAFFRGWLTEFTDSDAVSLICPRPLLVQHGKKDRIAWWPQVNEEFAESREHYVKLGIADRIEMDMHEGGHEISLETGLAFVKRWLAPRPGGRP
jgi:hypothetical protein